MKTELRFTNLIRLLRFRAADEPDRLAYTFLRDGEVEEQALTYGELERRARAIGAWLQSRKLQGERVLLLYPPGLEYIAAFWGCLYAGAVAVPAYPPRLNRNLQRLQAVVADAQAAAALTTRQVLSRIEAMSDAGSLVGPLACACTEELSAASAEQWREPQVEGSALAFLQYTSGSTGAPKGVMVSHGNLLHNEEMIKRAFRQDEHSVIVGWLPLYHDMGLIGNVLQPLYVGASCVLMSPVAFLQKPLRWLEAISRYRATTSGGPNFAYDLCVRKIDEQARATLDLSSWSAAFNGAEPVHAETLRRFADAFEPYGFSWNAFHPCYGLAEATLLVTGGRAAGPPVVSTMLKSALEAGRAVESSAADAEGSALVGCGGTLLDERLEIVNPDTLAPCADGEVGEIWVSGASIAQGYWNRPEETAQTFNAELRDRGDATFLRTGDLGFRHRGELFITGRLKDLIIIRGRNLYPQDIERTAEQSHAALRPGCGVAFSIESGGEERLVVVYEVERRATFNADEVVALIRQAVTEEHEVQPCAVALVKAGAVPKTSSGKLQRRLCKQLFLSSELETVSMWHAGEGVVLHDAEPAAVEERPGSAEELAAFIRRQLASKLGVATASIETAQPITRYGVDSLLAIELSHLLESKLGVNLPVATLLQSPSIEELAAQARAQLTGRTTNELRPTEATYDEGQAFALSHGQQALWFLHRMNPESAAYHIACGMRLRSEVEPILLRRCFEMVVQRHASLRTTFEVVEGMPVQRVREHLPLDFEEVDAATWSEPALQSWLAEQTHRPFNLDGGSLLRVRLLRRERGGDILLVVVHHIVVDFWSLAILLHEIGGLYEAERHGAASPLAPVRAHYGDYVSHQSRLIEGDEGERLWRYWQRQLGGALPSLNLPTDRPRPPVQTYRGASHAFKLDAELTRRLKELGRVNDATTYMVLLAAFEVLLYRYTGQEETAVGSPAAGRGTHAFADVVGYFVNPLVMRVQVEPALGFIELLSRVRRTVLDAYAHADFPFMLLVQRLQPERDPSRSPLFQAMFALQQTPLLRDAGLAAFALGEAGAEVRVGEFVLESINLQQRVAQFDLRLAMAEADEGMRASLEYNADLFDAATVERMAEHFEVLLRAIVANPQRPVSELPLLTEPERRQLLVEWNETAIDYPSNGALHLFIEAQVARTPGAVAVVCEQEQVTYAELNWRANQLAHLLRSLGVGAESLVGVMMERSVEMVVALLGVLKAGGAYVPIDPTYPAERVRYMLEDARLPVLLTQARLRRLLPACAAQVICLDEEGETLARQSEVDPPPNVAGANLAYCIYTSGSTGRPKGALNTHRAIINRLLWMQDEYNLRASDSVLQKTPFSFDVSVWEFFWPLMMGARLVLARPGGHQDPDYLARIIADQRITTLHFVPSMLQVFLGAADASGCAHLKRVICSGEALSAELQERFFERLPLTELHNLYGPTEAAVDVTYWACARDAGRRSVPIGRPIANTEIYILDRAQRPVPVGVAGELYIGGVGVGRGYLGRAGLTAEKFIPHPFGRVGGARLYRTGDLARYLSDGQIEFLGRIDHQVKVRGLRIELGEIESALLEREEVRECVVVAREDAPGDVRLVAYVVSDQRLPSSINEWRRALGERLPEYMVPSAFVLLEELPLSPNGKIERRALPAPTDLRPASEREFVAARNQVEEVLADIWSSVLGVRQVGIYDNFFELGGHSLLATQVVARIRQACQVELPVRCVFEAPTVSALGERVAAALAGGDSEAQSPPGRCAEREEHPSLSFVQQRLWFLDQLEPHNVAYNIPIAVRLSGALDVDVLERSVGEVVSRHEALRTNFKTLDGRPVQSIHPAREWHLERVDLRSTPSAEREAEAMRLAREEARLPFDLAGAPLLRARLLRLDGEEYMLLLTMHHIVSDGWSITVFVRELTALYEAFAAGEPSPLPALPLQYADYAGWQRERLSGELLRGQLDYWKAQLGGELPVIELPGDRPRPPVATYRGASEPWSFPAEPTAGLKALGQRRGATLFMTLLAAFQTLLHSYTGLEDILVGTPIAGRTHPELEPLIGFFANTLVIRGDLSNDPSFESLLAAVRETTLEAHARQEVPFEMLVEELQPTRDLSHTPLFQVMLAMENAPPPELSLPGVAVRQVEVDSGTAKFDLILFIRETPEGLAGRWEYNTDQVDAATIQRMAGHFENVLRGILASPQQRLSELHLLTKAEEQQLLFEWNDNAIAYPHGQCLHQLFETQAEQAPHAIALLRRHERWTYKELNRRANQLAHHLKSLGIGAESLVGVMMERTMELVVALLGVLKAGGAYVPIDPAYPRERVRFMLEDSAARVLLTQARLTELLPVECAAQVICLDAEWESVAQQSEENPEPSATAENLAYVIYTSGSTGRPKGVAIEHRSAATLVQWSRGAFGPARLAGVLAATSICFDLSVFEIFATLDSGGKIVLAVNALELPELPNADEVTLINTVPSVMAELLRMSDALPPVPTINLAGEALPNALVQRLYEQPGVEQVVNLYGPSEDTTYSTWAVIEKGGNRVPPIGRPIANTRAYVLDRALRPVPVGVAGELYLGGAGLARGYLNRAGLTAAKFIPDPFGAEAGGRLYQTGDLARYHADGQLEYLGRLDHQVKVRGFRIELGEIEAALARHHGVQDAVVLARRLDPGEYRLDAYVVTRPGLAPTSSELRQQLREHLPEYMVPSVFVMLDELPLTPNGKLDRRALLALEPAEVESEGTYLAPRTPLEQEVSDIWASLLGVTRVGIGDSFFDLGGHSLLATQIVSRVRERFRVELPLRAIFESPTVAGLASHLETVLRSVEVFSSAPPSDTDDNPSPLLPAAVSGEQEVARVEMFNQALRDLTVPPILPVTREAALPLSFAQQRLWFLDQLAPGNSAYNIVGGMRLSGALDVAALERALNEIVRRHEALRTTFTTLNGWPVQVTSAAQPHVLRLVDLRVLDGAEEREAKVLELAQGELAHPFDLTQGPLLRVSLLQLANEEHVALVTMHHIVSDGWSTDIFVREVVTLYEAFHMGRPSPLAELPVQYADFAHWQREWLQGEVLEAQLDYWKRTLGGALPVLELPTDNPRSSAPTLRGEKLFCKLPDELSAALRGLSRREGVTLYMTLLAAFQTLLHRYTMQDDLIVGTAIAGRNRAEVENLIGVFINMLVLRTDLSGNPTFRELLGRVREVTLGAYAHQDMPFEKLVEELQPARALAQTPLFQVAFGLQSEHVQQFRLPGLKLSPLTFDTDIARYDLTLWMLEAGHDLTSSWTYSTDYFKRESIRRMQGHFEQLLRSIVADPDARLASLEMLTEEEKRLRAQSEKEREALNVNRLLTRKRQAIRRPPESAN